MPQPTTSTLANLSSPWLSSKRRNVRRLLLASEKQDEIDSQRYAYRTIRRNMLIACVAICYSIKLPPTRANLSQARQTIYKWARLRDTEWHVCRSVLQSLSQVVEAAIYIGLPACQWESNSYGRWPQLRFPEYAGSYERQVIVLKEYERSCLQQAIKLQNWYESFKKNASL